MIDGRFPSGYLTFMSERRASRSPLTKTTMRRSVLLGIALIVVGGTVFLRGLSSPREILKVGDISVSADEPNPIVPWATGLAVLAGLVLVTTGPRRKA